MPQGSQTGSIEGRLCGDWKTARRAREWPGVTVETVSARSREPFSFGFDGSCALLSLNEKGYRSDGETSIGGLAPSRRRSLGGLLVFVPPGATLSGWSNPTLCSTWLNIYLGPSLRSLEGTLRLDALGLEPRVHFVDPAVRTTMEKLKALMDGPGAADALYAEMLCGVLVAELKRCMRRDDSNKPEEAPGRLDGVRERKLRAFIEERLAESLTLDDLADLVGLSPLHLVRTFKRTIGTPPHRYIVLRRVERAKALLANRGNSVTEVALATGFGSSSHFCHSFRGVTGLSPTAYRKILDA